ncbi:MAG: CPBP family intramembrane glutamic endopeptidase [Nocardioidaceae bacterium]
MSDTITVVAALVVLNAAQDRLPARSVVPFVLAAGLLVAHARRRGLDWDELGLSPQRWGAGARWGGSAAAAVAAVWTAGVALPPTRAAFVDPRHEGSLREVLGTALVVVPLRTVLVEEVAFRSVLWGVLGRHTSDDTRRVVASASFGLWHVVPALRFAAARGVPPSDVRRTAGIVLGTVAVTGAAGAVLGELRRRSRSVLAAAALHWAANGLGVLGGVAARRLAGR